ncbi:MAG: hypothetical protein P4L62_04200 [Candidatus Pacebacteria bacterium]|nr:hypothetical protein [Candidatus Paceibacterota bacterium]
MQMSILLTNKGLLSSYLSFHFSNSLSIILSTLPTDAKNASFAKKLLARLWTGGFDNHLKLLRILMTRVHRKPNR